MQWLKIMSLPGKYVYRSIDDSLALSNVFKL